MDELIDDWIPYRDQDWDNKEDSKIQFNLDTRDFMCNFSDRKIKSHEYQSLIRREYRYKWYKDEMLNFLDKLKADSGGDCEWRFLSIPSTDTDQMSGWRLKYFRIIPWRSGFLICNSEGYTLRKDLLQLPIDKELLGAH